MYKDHVTKSLIIILLILLSIFLPLLFLKIFYGNYSTFVFGNMFSKVFEYVRYGYFGYIYVSPSKHSSAMLGVYFYLVLFLLFSVLAFIFGRFLLKEPDKNIKDYCVKSDKKNRFTLDVLDDKKQLKK